MTSQIKSTQHFVGMQMKEWKEGLTKNLMKVCLARLIVKESNQVVWPHFSRQVVID
jgi:hypothetical protein